MRVMRVGRYVIEKEIPGRQAGDLNLYTKGVREKGTTRMGDREGGWESPFT